METRRAFPEEILVEILARLPLRSIASFRSVCKIWKSVIESPYLRRRFAFTHKSSSSSWSLMLGIRYPRPITEVISFHGCETWDLPKSLASYILPFQPYPNTPPTSRYSYVASSNGLIWIDVIENSEVKSFVGNPVLQQWVEIPPPPEPCKATGLVTRLDDEGDVSSFKVVMTCRRIEPKETEMFMWRVYVYSSLTGLWTCQRLVASCPVYYGDSYPSMDLNGMLYLYYSQRGVLVAHDFYAEEADDDQCRVIPLPLPLFVPYNKYVRRCLTTSRGDVILIEVIDRTLNVWRLKNNNADGEWWQLWWEEINLVFGNCFPMAMNPFDSDIIYLWSIQHGCLVLGNLRTREFIIHQECCSSSKSCVVDTNVTKVYMQNICDLKSVIMFGQYVLPQWMNPVPRPPN